MRMYRCTLQSRRRRQTLSRGEEKKRRRRSEHRYKLVYIVTFFRCGRFFFFSPPKSYSVGFRFLRVLTLTLFRNEVTRKRRTPLRLCFARCTVISIRLIEDLVKDFEDTFVRFRRNVEVKLFGLSLLCAFYKTRSSLSK